MNLRSRAKLWWGLYLLGLALLLRIIFLLFPAFGQWVYFERFFPALRHLQSWLYPLWLLPGYTLLVIGLLIWLVLRFPQKGKWQILGRRLANLIGFWGALFLICFGYAYLDRGFASRSNLPEPPSEIDIITTYFEAIEDCMQARTRIADLDSSATIVDHIHEIADSTIASSVRKVLDQAAYPVNWKSVVRTIRPEGTLRRLSISGIYNPFTGEANIDPALPNLSMLFVKAHELAHAYGITSEAEANFVAYLACIRSTDAMMNYAGTYALWRQIAQEVNRTQDVQTLSEIKARIPLELLRDREAIRATYLKHQAYFPELSESINDSYLKLQGVTEGTEDYDRFLQLYLAWKLTE